MIESVNKRTLTRSSAKDCPIWKFPSLKCSVFLYSEDETLKTGYQVVCLPRSPATQDGVSKSPSKRDDVSHK